MQPVMHIAEFYKTKTRAAIHNPPEYERLWQLGLFYWVASLGMEAYYTEALQSEAAKRGMAASRMFLTMKEQIVSGVGHG